MKKIISILLITIAIFSLNHAYADDFSIRGGIRFGMSIEEVKKIEKEINGLNPSSTNSDELGYKVSSLIGVSIGKANSDIITYSFTNNQLSDIRYWYGYYDSSALVDNNLTEIKSSITKKYGKPLHDADGEIFSVFSGAFHHFFKLKGMGISYDLRNYCEWLVEFDDTYVVIDTFSYNTNPRYILEVGFTPISHERVLQIIRETIQEENNKKEQKNNDI